MFFYFGNYLKSKLIYQFKDFKFLEISAEFVSKYIII
jgi:hypothetical protein